MAREAYGRHTVRVCLVIACIVFTFATGGHAASKVKLNVGDGAGFAGGPVNIDITMNAVIKPSAIGFWLEYDSSKLTFNDAVPGAVVTLAGKDVSWDFPSPGRVSFVIFGLNDTRISSGRILTVTFGVPDPAPANAEFDITGLNASATDPNANPISTEIDDGEITILDCFTPAAPASFVATDGLFGDHVQLTWTPVFGAQSYVVRRNSVNDPATAAILAVTVLPFYSDFSAQGASYVGVSAGGCSGASSQTLRYAEYYYWIQAQNICGQSGLLAEVGWRGKSDTAIKAITSVNALPGIASESTSQVALRLSSDRAIQERSVTASVSNGVQEVVDVAWRPTNSDGSVGWVVVTLDSTLSTGDAVTVAARGTSISGATAGPVSHTFVCDNTVEVSRMPIPAKSGDTIATPELTAAGIPDFLESIGPRYVIYPDTPFDEPAQVRIPVPGDVDPSGVLPHLFVPDTGWCPGPLVEDWIVPGSMTISEEDGTPAITFDVNFGGVIQLGYMSSTPASAGPSSWAGGIPTGLAALVLGVTVLIRHRRCAA